jgi:hypothetical protein
MTLPVVTAARGGITISLTIPIIAESRKTGIDVDGIGGCRISPTVDGKQGVFHICSCILWIRLTVVWQASFGKISQRRLIIVFFCFGCEHTHFRCCFI